MGDGQDGAPQDGLNMTTIKLQLNRTRVASSVPRRRGDALHDTRGDRADLDRSCQRSSEQSPVRSRPAACQAAAPAESGSSIDLRPVRKELPGLDQYQAEGVVHIWLPTRAFDSLWTGMSHSPEADETMTLPLITTSPGSALSSTADSINGEPPAWLIEVETPILIHDLDVSIHRSLAAIQRPAG